MTVLAYHSVSAGWDDPLAVRPADFERQMRALIRRQPVCLPDYVAALGDGRGAGPLTAVTFDDGYADNLALGLEVCAALGIRPAVFLATDHIDSGEPLGWRPECRTENRPLTWDEVRTLAAAGWTMGSHTTGHEDLVAAADQALSDQLTRSKARIEEMLDTPCELLSYPYGRHDERVRRAAEAAGYHAAFTLPTGREPHDGMYAIPRIGIFRDDSALMVKAKISGLALAAKLAVFPAHPVEGSAEGIGA
jgi:peptidoglycan/xylan/chitin deacetylase (PgdA/CDA1 family)